MNKLISDNYWFGCDWVIYEVGYLGLRAGQLSPACAVVYLWKTGYLRVTRPRSYPGIQQLTFLVIMLKVVDLKVDLKSLRLVNLTGFWSLQAHTQWR